MDAALEYVSKLGVHPDLAERLREIGEGVGASPLRIGEGAALVHPNGLGYAIAHGTSSLALRLPPAIHAEAALAPGSATDNAAEQRERTLILEEAVGPDWVAVDPWPLELSADDGVEQLRRWCRAAHAYVATLEPWPRP